MDITNGELDFFRKGKARTVSRNFRYPDPRTSLATRPSVRSGFLNSNPCGPGDSNPYCYQSISDIDSLRNIALDCAHQLTDLVGYASGCFFDVEIVSAVSRNSDEWRVFGVQIPVLVERKNSHRSMSIDGELILAVSGNIPAQMVLRDFQQAMRDAIGTGFYCYRAIEAMMQSMKVGEITSDKLAWEQAQSFSVARSLRIGKN